MTTTLIFAIVLVASAVIALAILAWRPARRPPSEPRPGVLSVDLRDRDRAHDEDP